MTTVKSRTSRKAPRIASPKELQAQAAAALKDAKAGEKKSALASIGAAHMSIYALVDYGKNYAALPIDAETAYSSIVAHCDTAREAFADAADALARSKHPAIVFLRKAADALVDAERIAGLQSEYVIGGPEELHILAHRTYGKIVGKALLSFTLEAARWMERAEEALGDHSPCGWLALDDVPGFPDEFVRVRSAAVRTILADTRAVERSSDAGVQRIAELVKAVKSACGA